MSITFSPTLEKIGYTLACGFDDSVYPTGAEHAHPLKGGCVHAREFRGILLAVGDFDEARRVFGKFADSDLDYWDDCLSPHGLHTRAAFKEVPEVQMSNTNAFRLLEVLGVVGEQWCGEFDPEDLLGRILVAQAVYPGDPGALPETSHGAQGATLIYCGRRAGYVEEKLEALVGVVEHAQSHGLKVQWG